MRNKEDSEFEIFKLLVSIVFSPTGPSGWIVASFFKLDLRAFFLTGFLLEPKFRVNQLDGLTV